jgi:hypothetical protein
MAKLTIALVGSLGVASQGGAANTAVTPAWGTSENRTAGNLLICWVAVTGTATLPATPTGWTIAKQQAGTSTSATVYYKIATGTDTAPTIAAIASGTTAVQLGEFTNNTNSTTGVLDKTGGVASTTSPATATFSAADKFQPDFWVAAGADFRSAARTPNDTWTGTNITAVAAGNNNGTSSVNHYSFAYDLDTSANASADSAILTASVTTSLTGLAVAAASFTTANVQQAQAQADIKAIGRGFGQTQAKISTTRQWAQAAAFINGSFFAPFTDNFNRTVVDSFGTSTNTDTWVLKNGTTANADVNGSVGTIVTSATQQIWDLNKTVISGRGLEFSGIVSINKAPVDLVTIYLGVVRSFTDPFPSEFISSAAISINATTILIQAGIESGIGGGASTALTPGSSYNFKLQSIPSSNSNTFIRAKIWLVGTTEPDWTETSSAILILRPSPGHIRLYVESETDTNTPFIWSVDDLHSEEAFITYSGQAQASIKGTARGYAQTQADIKAVNFGFAQSNADIKAVSNAFAQTQADIKAISFGFAQTQADIKAVGYGFAQSQADIKAISYGFGQSNADIKAVSFGFGQTQADIKAVSFGFAQAQSDIKAVGYGFGQTQSNIKAVAYSFGQSQVDIKATSNGFAQTNATIKATSNGFGQALALIPNWFSGQANAVIGGQYTSVHESFNRTVASGGLGTSDDAGDWTVIQSGAALSVNGSAALISSTASPTAELQNVLISGGFEISTTFQIDSLPASLFEFIDIAANLGIGSTLATSTAGLRLRIQVLANGNLTLLSLIEGNSSSGNSVTAQLNTSYIVKVQFLFAGNDRVRTKYKMWEAASAEPGWRLTDVTSSTAHLPGHVGLRVSKNNQSVNWLIDSINIIPANFTESGQAQASIKATTNGFGQSNTDIKAISYGFGQTQSDIKAVGYGFGQAQADTKSIVYSFGQSQTDIKATSNSFAQSNADIKSTSNGFGQALALIPNWFSGQANALISGLYTFITDSFTRTVSNGLGNDDQGDIYVLVSGTASDLSVDGSKAVIIDSANQETVNLKNTLLGSTARGVSVKFTFVVDALPDSGVVLVGINTGLGSSETSIRGFRFALAAVAVNSVTTIFAGIGINGSTDSFSFGAYAIGTVYQFDGLIVKSSNSTINGRAKIYPVGAEVAYQTATRAGIPLPGHVALALQGPTSTGTVSLDNLVIIDQSWSESGQAQAKIKATSNGFGQSNADIKAVSYGFGQTQSDIKATSFGFGQALALIPNWKRGQTQAFIVKSKGLGQTAALINGQYRVSVDTFSRVSTGTWGTNDTGDTYTGSSTANFNTDGSVGTVQSTSTQQIIDLNNTLIGTVGQAVSIKFDFKVSSDLRNGNGTTNALLIQSNVGSYAGATPSYHILVQRNFPGTAFILFVGNGTLTGSQVSSVALSTDTWYTVETTFRKSIVRGKIYVRGQQADYNSVTAFTTEIPVPGRVEMNVLAMPANTPLYSFDNIEVIDTSWTESAQAQAKIISTAVTTVQQFAQAQADIKATSNGYAQAQATIQGNVFGQSQADIKQSYQGYANTQADILATSQGYGQTQSDIKAVNAGYGQAQSDIKATNTGSGNAQAAVTQTYFGCANAASSIKATTTTYGQCQANILNSYQAFAQAQAKINAFGVQGYGQAQGNLQFTGTLSNGQAQAKINAFGTVDCGQAQSDIKTTSQRYGQTQADIKVTSQSYGQAQANIVTTFQNFAQSQGTIKATTTASGNTKADILTKYQAYGNAQASIKITVIGVAQAQGDIKAKSYGFGQCQGYVITTGSQAYGLAQGSILASYVTCANTQAFIKKSAGYSNSQAFIKQDRIVKNLALSDDKPLILSLSDELVSTLTLSDTEEITTTASDSESVTLALSDDLLISLELSDEGL